MGNAAADPAITWLGHATVLLGLGGTRLLTDPVLGTRVGPLVRVAPAVELPADGVDAVLLSHLHADHAHLRSLRAVGRGVPVFAPAQAAEWLRRRGLSDVRGLEPGQEMELGGVRILATPAVHHSARRPFGPRADPIGFLVRGSISVYFAGDTDLFDGMSELRGQVDVALLPVWGWGPSVGHGHLDPERAARALELIAPRVAIPIHWGTFALPRPLARTTDYSRPAREFAALAAASAPGVVIRILAPGERVAL